MRGGGVEAAVFSRNRLDLRVKTRAATSHAAKIDCSRLASAYSGLHYRSRDAF